MEVKILKKKKGAPFHLNYEDFKTKCEGKIDDLNEAIRNCKDDPVKKSKLEAARNS